MKHPEQTLPQRQLLRVAPIPHIRINRIHQGFISTNSIIRGQRAVVGARVDGFVEVVYVSGDAIEQGAEVGVRDGVVAEEPRERVVGVGLGAVAEAVAVELGTGGGISGCLGWRGLCDGGKGGLGAVLLGEEVCWIWQYVLVVNVGDHLRRKPRNGCGEGVIQVQGDLVEVLAAILGQILRGARVPPGLEVDCVALRGVVVEELRVARDVKVEVGVGRDTLFLRCVDHADEVILEVGAAEGCEAVFDDLVTGAEAEAPGVDALEH